jgi:hypothetical protein
MSRLVRGEEPIFGTGIYSLKDLRPIMAGLNMQRGRREKKISNGNNTLTIKNL